MSNEFNGSAQFGATFKVSGAGWTPGAFAGQWLIDASGTRRVILGNSADTLFLAGSPVPDVGIWATFGTPGWVANQFRNTAQVASVFVDSRNKAYTVLQNTTDTLVTSYTADTPVLPPATIIQGGRVVAKLTSAPSATGTGVWEIVDDAATVGDSWLMTGGAVTATAGGHGIPPTLQRRSQAMDIRGVDTLSIVAGFYAAAASSPSGTLNAYINNKPGPQIGASVEWGTGPASDDPGWAKVKVCVDGAAASAGAVIADANPHVIVPEFTPNSPRLRARWLMLEWVPGNTPGTGTLDTQIYGYGAA